MSSSRHKHKSRRPAPAASTNSSYYPTAWSKWEWNFERSLFRRYRLRAEGEYEYEWDESGTATTASSIPTDPAVPRTATSQQDTNEGEPESSSRNYIHSSTSADEITQSLAQYSLNSNHTTTWAPRNSLPIDSSRSTHITTIDPNATEEALDKHYKVHDQKDFKDGRVFKVLWSEPRGNGKGSRGYGTTNSESLTEGIEGFNKYGERSFQEIRRFVIIRALEGHCICLPINTYQQQGVNKRGVHAYDHTIVYSDDEPVYLNGERAKGLTRAPLRMSPRSKRDKLHPASRMNYAKVYTVEYNVKVWFIGKIHDDSMWQLGTDWNQVHPPMDVTNFQQPSYYQQEEMAFATGGTHDGDYSTSHLPGAQMGSYSRDRGTSFRARYPHPDIAEETEDQEHGVSNRYQHDRHQHEHYDQYGSAPEYHAAERSQDTETTFHHSQSYDPSGSAREHRHDNGYEEYTGHGQEYGDRYEDDDEDDIYSG